MRLRNLTCLKKKYQCNHYLYQLKPYFTSIGQFDMNSRWVESCFCRKQFGLLSGGLDDVNHTHYQKLGWLGWQTSQWLIPKDYRSSIDVMLQFMSIVVSFVLHHLWGFWGILIWILGSVSCRELYFTLIGNGYRYWRQFSLEFDNTLQFLLTLCNLTLYMYVGRLVDRNPLPEEDCFVPVKIMSNCEMKHGAVGLFFSW